MPNGLLNAYEKHDWRRHERSSHFTFLCLGWALNKSTWSKDHTAVSNEIQNTFIPKGENGIITPSQKNFGAWELHNSAMGRDTLALFDNTSLMSKIVEYYCLFRSRKSLTPKWFSINCSLPVKNVGDCALYMWLKFLTLIGEIRKTKLNLKIPVTPTFDQELCLKSFC